MRSSGNSGKNRSNNSKFYEVEDIVNFKVKDGVKYYLVRWIGYPSDDSWEPEANLSRVRGLIERYHERNHQSCSQRKPEISRGSSTFVASASPRRRSRVGNYAHVHANAHSSTNLSEDMCTVETNYTDSDLYSRVKTRRRGSKDGHSTSPTSSLSEHSNALISCIHQGDPSTSNPISQSIGYSLGGPISCSVSNLSPHLFDQCHQQQISDSKPFRVSQTSKRPRSTQSAEHQSSRKHRLASNEDSSKESTENATSSMDMESANGCEIIVPSQAPFTKSEELSLREWVPSSEQLMMRLLDLSTKERCEIDVLTKLPVLRQFVEGVNISSHSDLIRAITNQHWPLIATQPVEEIHGDNPQLVHPLVAAVVYGEGQPFLLKRLLAQGEVNPNMVDQISKWPVLMIAVFYGRIQAARVLLEAGALRNTSVLVHGKRRTALGMAISLGDLDMLSLLILYGANPYKVNDDMTSLQFTSEMLKAVVNKIPFETIIKPATGYSVSQEENLLEFAKAAPDAIPPPVSLGDPCPIPHPLCLALPASATQSCAFDPDTLSVSFGGQTAALPSVKSLQCIEGLLATYHARFSRVVWRTLDKWLKNARMTVDACVTKAQWIYPQGRMITLDFPKPDINADTVLVFVVIHGILTPPGCYHLWIGDEGPCLITRVVLEGVNQRPLERQLFVSTLMPLDRSKTSQRIEVHLSVDNGMENDVCLVPLVLKLKPLRKDSGDEAAMHQESSVSGSQPRLRSSSSLP